MKIAICFIGTNQYSEFFNLYYPACEKFLFPNVEKKYLVFTDQVDNPIFNRERVTVSKIKHEPWPFITLWRFKFIKEAFSKLEDADYCLFLDADLIPQSEISLEDVFSSGKDLVGVQHPGFIGKIGPFETRPQSTAGVLGLKLDLKTYCQGCLWGGTKEAFKEMVFELTERVEKDLSNDIIAAWHDESQMNKYFAERREKVHVLHAGYATPETEGYAHLISECKCLHLNKPLSEFPRFEGAKK